MEQMKRKVFPILVSITNLVPTVDIPKGEREQWGIYIDKFYFIIIQFSAKFGRITSWRLLPLGLPPPGNPDSTTGEREGRGFG